MNDIVSRETCDKITRELEAALDKLDRTEEDLERARTQLANAAQEEYKANDVYATEAARQEALTSLTIELAGNHHASLRLARFIVADDRHQVALGERFFVDQWTNFVLQYGDRTARAILDTKPEEVRNLWG